jgi:hypothetical protein
MFALATQEERLPIGASAVVVGCCGAYEAA